MGSSPSKGPHIGARAQKYVQSDGSADESGNGHSGAGSALQRLGNGRVALDMDNRPSSAPSVPRYEIYPRQPDYSSSGRHSSASAHSETSYNALYKYHRQDKGGGGGEVFKVDSDWNPDFEDLRIRDHQSDKGKTSRFTKQSNQRKTTQ